MFKRRGYQILPTDNPQRSSGPLPMPAKPRKWIVYLACYAGLLLILMFLIAPSDEQEGLLIGSEQQLLSDYRSYLEKHRERFKGDINVRVAEVE